MVAILRAQCGSLVQEDAQYVQGINFVLFAFHLGRTDVIFHVEGAVDTVK